MSAQSLISQGYSGYAGWGDAEADADFKATGGSGKKPSYSSPSQNIASPIDQAKQLNDFYVQQNQPAIQSLQASKAPLQQRYADLVSSIKGNQQVAENRQTVSTKNELGRRGIVGGGLYDQELTGALNPITQQYASLLGQANTGQGQDEATINNQIAMLQAGNPQSAVSGALQYSGLQQQAQQQAAAMALQQQQLSMQQNQQSYNQNFQTQQLQSAMNKLIPLSSRYGLYDPNSNSILGASPLASNSTGIDLESLWGGIEF